MISADPDAVAKTDLDTGYQESVEAVVSEYLSERKMLSQDEHDDGTVHREIRCVLGIELPGGAKRFIGNKDPAWIEQGVYSPRDLSWEWTIKPEVGGGLMSAGGHTVFRDHADGTLRAVSGEVSFHVPIYGRRVEEVVVDHLEKTYAAEARHLADWIASRS